MRVPWDALLKENWPPIDRRNDQVYRVSNLVELALIYGPYGGRISRILRRYPTVWVQASDSGKVNRAAVKYRSPSEENQVRLQFPQLILIRCTVDIVNFEIGQPWLLGKRGVFSQYRKL
jgi:hypothetical protein